MVTPCKTLTSALDEPPHASPRTPIHADTNENSQTFSSPQSVITEPDQQEIDMANILIQMSNTTMDASDMPIPQNYVIDKEHELPVNTE